MELGDPKQVAILSVMALGAVGFLFTRLGGRGEAPAAPIAQVARAASAAKPVGALAFSTDPFSHPRLAPVSKVAPAVSVSPGTAPGGISSPPVGALPPVGPLMVKDRDLVAVRPAAKAAPKPVAKPAPEATTVALEGLAGASDTVAFLSVGGAESQPFRPGDRIAGGVRLVRVVDGAVILSGTQGELTLEVGERARL